MPTVGERFEPSMPRPRRVNFRHAAFLPSKAEVVRFELTVPFGTQSFQDCALSRYATPPLWTGLRFVPAQVLADKSGTRLRALVLGRPHQMLYTITIINSKNPNNLPAVKL